MISRIAIRNFLSLGDVDVRLGKLNVLIGPNASGKSNFVKALMLLRNTALVGYPVLDENASEIPFTDIVYGHNNYSTIEIRVEIPMKSGGTAVYVIRIDAFGYEEEAYLNDKKVYYRGKNVEDAFYIKSTGFSNPIRNMPAKEIHYIIRNPYPPEPPEGVERRTINLYESLLKRIPPDVATPLRIISSTLRGIGVFRPDPFRMRFASNITDPPSVGYHGENLARYLLYLYLERPEVYSKIEEVVKSLIPEVERLMLHLEGTSVELWVRTKGLNLPLRPGFISDGTLRLLAITTLLYSGFSVIAIEEPENHVHPYLLEALVDLARRSPSQVIFTTHSPHLLDYVKPEEVYLVGKVGTETRIRRLTDTSEVEKVRRFLEEGGRLGEAWFSRLFGEQG